MTVATLQERVDSHIRFFWTAVAGGIFWLGAISATLFNMNGTMNRVERAQADAPATIVAGLLKGSGGSKSDEMAGLVASATVFRTAKLTAVKPDNAALSPVAAEILKAQAKYPEQAEVWQATSAFINYKSVAFVNRPTVSGACHPQFGPAGVILTHCELDLESLVSCPSGS
jgi:hypothetical protein